MSLKPGASAGRHHALDRCSGCAPARMFALSAIGYRGAILALQLPNFVLAATFTLAVGLVMQAALLTLYLCAARSARCCARSCAPGGRRCSPASWARSPRNSGSSPSRSPRAANVRTLALVEVLFAQAISHFVFKQPTTAREALGIVLMVVGVALLMWAY